MDISELSTNTTLSTGTASTGVNEEAQQATDQQKQRQDGMQVVNDEEDSRCNWDIELIQFVVESFICMFPEQQGARNRVRREDTRGRIRAQESHLSGSHTTHNNLSRNRSNNSQDSNSS